MNIIVATLYLPYPEVPHGGGQDLFHLVCFLAQRHDVRVVSFADEAQAAHVDSLRPHIKEARLVFPAVTLEQKLKRAAFALRTGVWPLPGQRADHEMRAAITGWARDADVLLCVWTQMGRYLAGTPRQIVRVLDEVDLRFVVERAAARLKPWRWLMVAGRQRQELSYCRAADLVLTRSVRDHDVLQRTLPDLRALVVPPVAHLREYTAIPAHESQPGRVLFVGAMDRARNQAAARWLVAEIWPLVQAAYPAATLRIVGSSPPQSVRELARVPGVTVTGHVDYLQTEYARARVVVAPMRSEAGALNKVLDGLAAGRPVVATTRANAGVGAPPDVICLADAEQPFASRIVKLLENQTEWERIGQAGRRFVQTAVDWPGAAQRLEATLAALVRERRLIRQVEAPGP